MASESDTVARRRDASTLLFISDQLSPEWKVSTTADQRVYFSNKRTRSTHWFPPPELWMSKLGLPYAWEAALDGQNKTYYINHVTRTTTREDPRSEADQVDHDFPMIPSQTRWIEVIRDANIGFGFVAGSEKPVVIRSVIPNGPSHEKLFANDQILKVNGKDVRDFPQADVINLIKAASVRIEMEVVASEDVQDAKKQRNHKSSLMSRTTRQRRKSTPVSVRFADEPALVQVIGPMEPIRRSSVPLIPNVLRVFLENGQTRSFRYDSNTTAEEIFRSLSEKLDLRLTEHFSLVLSGPKEGQISYIQNDEKISEIYTNRNCSSFNCLCKLNIAFMPKDHFELLSQDPNAFEYLYSQVTNRVVEGFYGMDLKYDLAIKLAALQIQQKTLEASTGRQVKPSVRQVKRKFGGLEKFAPSELLHIMREKELRKALDQQIKDNENLASPGEKRMSSLQCKLHYLNLVAMEIFSYGGRYFDVVLIDNDNEGPSLKKTRNEHTNATVLVNLKFGVSQVVRGKVNVLCQLAEFRDITGFTISRHEDHKKLLRVRLQEGKTIQLICTLMDCVDMIALITGYYKAHVDNTSESPLPVENEEKWSFSFRRDPRKGDAPDFYSMHQVIPDVWSYPSLFKSSTSKKKAQLETPNPKNRHKDVFIDLSRAPPRFEETVISEESKEETAEDVLYNDIDGETREVREQQFDSRMLVTTQGNTDVSEEASSTDLDGDGVSSEMPTADTKGKKTLSKRDDLISVKKPVNRDASVESSQEDEIGIDNVLDKRRDLYAALVPSEEIWQCEEMVVVVINKNVHEEAIRDEETSNIKLCDESDSDIKSSGHSEEPEDLQNDDVDGQEDIAFVPESLNHKSSINESRQSQHAKEDEITEYDVYSDASRLSNVRHSSTYFDSKGDFPEDASVCDDTKQARSDERHDLHLDEKDPAIDTDRSDMQSPVFGSSDRINKKNFNQSIMNIIPDNVDAVTVSDVCDDLQSISYIPELCEDLADRDSPLGSDQSDELRPLSISELDHDPDQHSSDSSTPELYGHLDDLDSHAKSKPPDEELQLGYSSLVDALPSLDDSENSNDSVDGDMFSLESVDSSVDTNEGSHVSDEDEPLWSTFPEFLQPSRRLSHSDTDKDVFVLAEDVGESETDQEVLLLNAKDNCFNNELNLVNWEEPCDFVLVQDGVFPAKDLGELSTTSSESLRFTHEVNAEFTQEDEMISDDDDCHCLREKMIGDDRKEEEVKDDKNGVPQCFYSSSYLHGLSLDTRLSLNRISKEGKTATSMSKENAVTVASYPLNNGFSYKETLQITETEGNERPPGELSQSNRMCGGSSPLTVVLTEHSLEKERIILEQFQSLSDPSCEIEASWKDLDKSYSPTDWIIPTPPTPTPELRENDIRIVSPPPNCQASIENEFDEELKCWIIPAPPSVADNIRSFSEIKIVSPPPPLKLSDNKIEHPLDDFDEIGFLSFIDDHILVHNDGLMSKQSSNLNVTVEKKIQAENISKDGSYPSKETALKNKQTHIPHRRDGLNMNEANVEQASLKQGIETNVVIHDSFESSGNSSNRTDQHDEATVDDCSHSKDFNSTDLCQFDSNNNENVTSSHTFGNIPCNKYALPEQSLLKQKPPVPPKPWFMCTIKNEDRTKTECSISSDNVKTANTPVRRSSSKTKSVSLKTKEQESSFKVNFNSVFDTESLHSQLVKIPPKPTKENTWEQKTSISLLGFHQELPRENKEQWQTSSQLLQPPWTLAEESQAKTRYDIGRLGRSLSFTHRSPYVPVPYLDAHSSIQSLDATHSLLGNDHKADRYSQRGYIESLESLRVGWVSPSVTSYPVNGLSSSVAVDSSCNESFHEKLHSKGNSPLRESSTCPGDLHGFLCRNLLNDDTNRVPQEISKASNCRVHTDSLPFRTNFDFAFVNHEDVSQIESASPTSPRLSESSPPPLPPTSPPKSFPSIDDDEFDFCETNS
ncbi:uncharacterized protein [Montipora foliosa]|uniref:uncharacterized protein isoform X1 n=1 Tax=Montipora foliosa TaxID=591990 RepID=UPI0035F12547